MTGQQPAQRRAIAAMGHVLGPDMLAAVQALYQPEQAPWVTAMAPVAVDRAYGPDARQRLDLYGPDGGGGERPGGPGRPVLLWVHGGGFVRGEKASSDHPYNAHVGRWAARHGMVGAVMNYRLAPRDAWPAGGEDVGAAIDWLRGHVAAFGGDPARIVAMGTSAGSVHLATHLRLRNNDPGIRAAILLSGLYGFTPLDDRDRLYYGDPADYPDRWPREAVIDTDLPLLLAWAEHDPARFQRETMALLSARLARHGRLPRAFCGTGHNHFSLAAHIGGSDTRLSDEIRAFVDDISREEQS